VTGAMTAATKVRTTSKGVKQPFSRTEMKGALGLTIYIVLLLYSQLRHRDGYLEHILSGKGLRDRSV
jgi:hypothetical protein